MSHRDHPRAPATATASSFSSALWLGNFAARRRGSGPAARRPPPRRRNAAAAAPRRPGPTSRRPASRAAITSAPPPSRWHVSTVTSSVQRYQRRLRLLRRQVRPQAGPRRGSDTRFAAGLLERRQQRVCVFVRPAGAFLVAHADFGQPVVGAEAQEHLAGEEGRVGRRGVVEEQRQVAAEVLLLDRRLARQVSCTCFFVMPSWISGSCCERGSHRSGLPAFSRALRSAWSNASAAWTRASADSAPGGSPPGTRAVRPRRAAAASAGSGRLPRRRRGNRRRRPARRRCADCRRRPAAARPAWSRRSAYPRRPVERQGGGQIQVVVALQPRRVGDRHGERQADQAPGDLRKSSSTIGPDLVAANWTRFCSKVRSRWTAPKSRASGGSAPPPLLAPAKSGTYSRPARRRG